MARPISFTFPVPAANSIAQSQTAASGASVQIDGVLRDYNQLTVGVQQAVVAAGVQATITITSTGNISTSTFTITGIDAAGNVLSTSIAGPNNSTASTGIQLQRLTGVTVGTAATTAFTIGTGTSGTTNWVQTSTFKNPSNLTVAAVVTATTIAATVQDTPNDVRDASFATTMIFTHPTINAVTTNTQSNYAYPARFVRSIATGLTASGGYTFTLTQAG